MSTHDETIDGNLPPPSTGAQRCIECRRWIVGCLCYGQGDKYPLCPKCADAMLAARATTKGAE